MAHKRCDYNPEVFCCDCQLCALDEPAVDEPSVDECKPTK
jgi:hypothetical protein